MIKKFVALLVLCAIPLFCFAWTKEGNTRYGSAKEENKITEREVTFQGVSLLIREKTYEGWRRIEVYDPADKVLYPRGLPFLKL